MRKLLWISVLSAALAGCVADAGVGVRATYVAPPPPPPPVATVTVTATPAPAPVVEADAEEDAPYVEPTAYVYVNPDVQVIEDYDYPVFYSGGLYWRYDGGVWYSSSWHDRGWVVEHNVPTAVVHIDRPEGYVHYHANVNARVGQPGYRNPQHVVVSHPTPPPHRQIVPSRPVHEAGHGPVERPEQHAQPTHYEGDRKEQPMPAQHEPPHYEGNHNQQPMPAQQPHEPPRYEGNHNQQPIPAHEPAKTGGYPAPAPTHAPAHEPAHTPSKAPTIPAKKK